jgi:hypothetical protein
MVFVVVAQPSLSRVFVGVGRVVVWVKTPLKTVAGGRVDVLVAVIRTVSVVVVASAVIVVVVETGVSAVRVVVSASGARRSRPWFFALRFCLAA